jgi:hypothetical protein
VACSDTVASAIVTLSKDYFSGYVGDLLITDAGENVAPANPSSFTGMRRTQTL